MAYNEIIGSASVTDAMVPDQTVKDILQEAPGKSVILERARHVAMSKKKAKQPVLSSLPEAYWVDGETGLKQTTKAQWENMTITAEELAVIVPIPDALIDDSDVPLWTEIQPLLTEAIGQKVDQAGLFGVDKPESWPTGLVPGAIAAKNTLAAGTNKDFGQDVAELASLMSVGGVTVTGFATRPGLQWKLVGMRDANGQPIYTQALAGQAPAGLYGFPIDEVRNGAWNAEAAELVAVDWSKVIVGVRQDITYDLFKEGVISDANGKVVLNLMQQDSKALRVVFRVGFQVAQPLARVSGEKLYPAGVLTPAAGATEPGAGASE